MPSRKRSSLSQNTKKSKILRQARSQESVEEREQRLNNERIRSAARRAGESSSEQEFRLSVERERRTLSRRSETATQRELRLTGDRERHTLSRESETFTDRELRLTADRERHALSRESETFTDRELRLTADSERHALSRESETFTDRELRLTADRERHALSRESETFTDRELRLTADRERHALSRESESFTDRELRLTADRERHALTRSLEDENTYQRRLEAAREYHDSLTQLNIERMINERQRIEDIRVTETDEQREVRLSADRLRHNLEIILESQEDSNESTNILPWTNRFKSGFTYCARMDYGSFSKIGDLSVVCSNCSALKWRKESIGFCCSNGKIKLPTFEDPPEPLKSLLSGEHVQSKHFLDNIRAFNSAFQMTSFGAHQITEGPFMPTFKIQGQVYHLIGSLLPENEPKFLQIYFVSDYNEQSALRNRNFPQLNSDLILQLQHMLHQFNLYIHSFKSALESLPQGRSSDFNVVISADRRPAGEHPGRHNLPTTNEVAVVLVDQECDRRDIVIRTRDNRLQRIFETHRAYDSLQYPLIYCRGEDGYNFAVYQVDPRTGAPNYNKKTSSLQFYCYHLQVRHNTFVYLQRFRALFNQFIVDMYAKIETERLVYIRTNQRQLRAEDYVHLRDAMRHDNNTDNLGRLVILPSSFTGGPRYMHERTQDAFCYVRKYGRPDLFITFTTNPKWDEITDNIIEGQASYDRHDIIARVFHLKLKLLIDLLTKEGVFGESLCFMYSVEWQKRGLPHAHILLWLKDKLRPNDIDSIISAEFPDPSADPVLYNIVKTHMVHGPCGSLNNNSPCMQNGRCTKRYPKTLVAQTVTGHDGYPLYRRRSQDSGGFTVDKRLFGQQITIDNRWVVPYSPLLSKTFGAHINVENCNSVESIKYICKYINKGSDQASFSLRNNEHDEITKFQSGRYISSSEAAWRIFSFPIHERHPPVMHLDVHLEGGQRIYFNPENVVERLENPRRTTLIAFFDLCNSDTFAKTLLYDEVPSYYTFDRQRGLFNRRRRGSPVDGTVGIFKDHVIGRIYMVHPNNQECFYLRLLLNTVRGPTSFADLRKVNDVLHTTYQAACQARHLLESDQHWDDTLAEACVSESPRRLRHLFVILLTFCGLSDAVNLWEKYKDKFSEDFFINISRYSHAQNNSNCHEIAINQCLLSIQEELTAIGGKLLSEYGLPTPSSEGARVNREYAAEMNYNHADLIATLDVGIPQLTEEQRTIFDRVCRSVDSALGEILFIDAPGGTGKTYLTKLILAKVRSSGKIAVAVASSGIAATLLPGGKTAHTMFKIPIDLDRTESPVCNIARNSDKAQVLRDCSLIIWDECTMANRKAVEAVDRTLRDIRRNDQPMGGTTVLFCGDFRQTLPVVPRGTRADEIKACLKSSNLWRYITPMYLTVNMRARIGNNDNAQEFSDLLLTIGNGTYPNEHGKVLLNENLCCKIPSMQELISSVYGDALQMPNYANSWLCERAILTPRNDQAVAINTNILRCLPGDSVEYTSINRVMDPDETTTYPIEFLESLSAPGLPAHKIILKVGVPIMLLRNLCPPKLCNGTRLKVTRLQRNIIEAEILSGCGAGDSVFIPRIPLIPNNFPFSFKRVQFPISLCYAMTINKAQGQTMKVAGIDLTTDCFSHGQLYVALSRVSCSRKIYVLLSEDSTSNIVYREALL